MTRRVRKTPSADAEIRSIMLWIARDNPSAALKWARDLDEKLRKLAEMPGSGTDRKDLRPGVRSSPFGNYLVFFKPARDGITVIRVLHGARDYTRFSKPD
jgi:toxin ParE1/3/4